MFSIVILTAFVLRIYYFDYTVNARPNVLHGTFRFFPNTLYGKVPNTCQLAVGRGRPETGGEARADGTWEPSADESDETIRTSDK